MNCVRRKASRESLALQRARSRCRGTANAASKTNYQERGITVCERWSSYQNFLADMGEAPPGAWLDRIDNNKGYSPDNCRWSTAKEQQRNRRNNRLLTVDGETMCVSAWAERIGISKSGLHARLARGLSPERAVTTLRKRRRQT